MGVSKMNQSKNIKSMQELVLYWIKNTRIPLTEISKSTGISRSTLYNWMEGKPIRSRNCDKILDIYRDEINIVNQKITDKGDADMYDYSEVTKSKENKIEAKYIIELQADKIKQQAKEIEMFKSYVETQPIQKKQWDDIDADMCSEVLVRNVFSLRSMERKMTIDKSGVKLEKMLGLPKGHNYFDDTRWYSMDDHPVNKIIDNDSLEELKRITNTLPSLFESLKFVIGSHYMTFPIVYQYKKARVKTMCYIRLDWKSSPKRILTKTIILNGD